MSQFNCLTEKQQEVWKKITEENLKKQSTPAETAWFEFSARTMGFEFMNKESGRKYSSLQMFSLYRTRPTKLNLLAEDCLDDWKRVIKTGWVAVDIGANQVGAVLAKEIPTYKKRKV
jgi:hypothetical protein